MGLQELLLKMKHMSLKGEISDGGFCLFIYLYDILKEISLFTFKTLN